MQKKENILRELKKIKLLVFQHFNNKLLTKKKIVYRFNNYCPTDKDNYVARKEKSSV